MPQRDRPASDFFDRYEPSPSGCHEWTGKRNDYGYGVFRERRVHRLVWEHHHGPIPAGLVVRHVVCDNPPCIRLEHLALGTPKDNSQDMVAHGRHWMAGWTHCPNGHEYPPDRPSGLDGNRCLECAKQRQRRYVDKAALHRAVDGLTV